MMKTLSATEFAEMSRQAGLPMDSAAIAEMQCTMTPQQMDFMMKMSTMQTNNPAAVADVSKEKAYGPAVDQMCQRFRRFINPWNQTSMMARHAGVNLCL